jgi:hypothetical protein
VSFDGPTARYVPFFFRHIKSGEETIALNILRAKRANPTIYLAKDVTNQLTINRAKKFINEEQNNLHAETPNQRAIFI